jgi:hypothetical protein
MICAVADDLLPRPTCQGSRCQDVKANFHRVALEASRPVAPARIFCSQEGPANPSGRPKQRHKASGFQAQSEKRLFVMNRHARCGRTGRLGGEGSRPQGLCTNEASDSSLRRGIL